MAISSVSSSYSTVAAMQAPAQMPRSREVEGDGDKDDGKRQAVAAIPPRPTVNTRGQTVGTLLNVQA